MESLNGSVERITFYHPENGYTVLRLKPERGKIPGADREGLVTATGNLPELSAGEYVHLEGAWVNHPRHGRQFQIQICERKLPATLTGIRRYLGSGLVRGIGSRLADRIVGHFGLRTLEVIETQPEMLQEVPDIGPKRADLIAAAWQEQKQIKEIMLFLHSYGISTNLAIKIYKQYGDQALAITQADPFRLAQDIHGVGFKTADRIARSLGIPADHPSRIEAGILYVLNQASGEGHVFLPQEILHEKAVDLLEVNGDSIAAAIVRLAQHKTVYCEALPLLEMDQKWGELVTPPSTKSQVGESHMIYGKPAIYPAALYHCEQGVAERLQNLAAAFPTRLSDLPPALILLDAQLSEDQRAAIRMALGNPLSILTGGPGTGKTTALKALITVLEAAGKKVLLASPTGRAAKRLSQATQRPASTIHRLLGFTPGEGFKHGLDRPLEADLIVIDEASMIDLPLVYQLLKAIQPGTHLLLVGDVDQLPSVGAGIVLRDLITSGLTPLTRLNQIFRQAARSQIITNAHRINEGQSLIFSKTSSSAEADFFLFTAETPEQAAEWVEDVVCQRIPQKFGFHPRDEVQVLAPMYRGPAGVTALNARLQARLTPGAETKYELTLFGQLMRVGDKVMQLANNYDKEVYNGDIGFLFAIDPVEHSLVVDFEGRAIAYDWSEADQLTLAYAVSVHKAQGAEYPAVVIPLVTQHYLMLQRNLLYTAVTRARKLCVLVGSRRAIAMAIRNNKEMQRFSALDWRLRQTSRGF